MQDKYRVKVIDRDVDRIVYDAFVDGVVICSTTIKNENKVDCKVFDSDDIMSDSLLAGASSECVTQLLQVLNEFWENHPFIKYMGDKEAFITSVGFDVVKTAFEAYEKRTGQNLKIMGDDDIEKE